MGNSEKLFGISEKGNMKTREELVKEKYELMKDLKEARLELKIAKTSSERYKLNKEIHALGMEMLENDSCLARWNARDKEARSDNFAELFVDMVRERYPNVYKEVSHDILVMMKDEE
jgi:hypothetical protein